MAQDRPGPERVGPERLGPERAGPRRAGSERSGSGRSGSGRSGSERSGAGRTGSDGPGASVGEPDTDRLEHARLVVDAALDKKAEQVSALDVRDVVSFTDTFVLATGNSDRHVRSIVDGITEQLRARGRKPLGVEGLEDARWVLMDCDDVVVHVFQHDVREHYDLERLWSDASRIEFLGAPEPRTSAP